MVILFLVLSRFLILASTAAGSGHHRHPHHSLHSDKAALLSFRRTIRRDPNSMLSNWEEASGVCNFTGVSCSRLHHRVVQLNLQDAQLEGLLSPSIANLTRLRSLNLSHNRLFGTIPLEFSSLRHLCQLLLDSNDLQGSLPESLSFLVNLNSISLMNNSLSGTIPPSLFSNCTLLRIVDLSMNNFTGTIPEQIGNCPNLLSLNLYGNFLLGELPFSLTNASQILNLDVGYNFLSGELPSKVVEKLPSLVFLHLSYTVMVSHDHNTNLDPFISSLANCTRLKELDLGGIGVGGALPGSIGQLVSLETLSLHKNHISGSIPPDIGKLSKLLKLNLGHNRVNGTVCECISDMSKLQQLYLSSNFFTGTIPAVFGVFPNLGLLDLSNNMLSGEIPSELGDLVYVYSLLLNNNSLSGTIPPSLGKCTGIYELDLSYNRLTGTIPPNISGLGEIRIFLNLSHNFLEGSLPVELSNLKNVQEMDLSSNNFTGGIFKEISGCIALRMINLSYNALTGNLPNSLGDLQNLETLDVSENNLSGTIPTSLNKVHTLTFLNLSFNNFRGTIPSGGIFSSVTYMSFLGKQRLCGDVPGIPFCSRKRRWPHSHKFLILFTLVISVSVFLLTICCVIGFWRIKEMVSHGRTEAVRNETEPEMIHNINIPRITYKELSEATGGFDEQRILGSGSYGCVYKGILPDGTTIAVKVLQVQSGNSTKSFTRECQVLKGIRHRNLIRIITACSLPDFKALVLPYMANGSLDSRLYPESGSSDLSLVERVNICSDIAEGMAYLHHHSPVKVVHCDLKPSNVLLNDAMTALVSDFGIARLVMTVDAENTGIVQNMGNSTANVLSGSIGYIAPEYGYGSSTSTKGDVYSFGVVVLEMVTRKRPTDDMFGGGLSLHRWVKSHYQGRTEKVVDSSLTRASRDQSPEVKKMWEVAIAELIELGTLCTQESPSTRPTMLDAADDLDRLKRYLSGDTTATFASSLGVSSSTILGDE